MNKFVLAKNPMRPDDDEVYIIHLLQPIAIIACRDSFRLKKKDEDSVFKNYSYSDATGEHHWCLSVHHFFTTDFLTEPAEQAVPILDKAWRWFRAYLQWEDNNIDSDEQASTS